MIDMRKGQSTTKTVVALCTALITAFAVSDMQAQRKMNFNASWTIGDNKETVTLPRAWNEDYAFKVAIDQLPDSVVWYRKEFKLGNIKSKKVFIEFEGVRQAGEVYLNGQFVGMSENGVMAFGLDLTPYIKKGKNLLEVRTDNSWTYHEKSSNSVYQWNDKNFNANYGGIPKNVWLYVTDEVYQTLPLYSNLQTTGTYVYLKEADINAHTATIGVETEVRNESNKPRTFSLAVDAPGMKDMKIIGNDSEVTLQPGETRILKTQFSATGIKWWSVGRGNLYDIKTSLKDEKGKVFDEVITRTGFRTTEFGDGMIRLNGQVIQVKGYAQRTSNEWPAVGLSVPAWLSDYSNGLMVASGANTVRWMHLTPWKQDIESCDRVGLMQAMPAGDSEKDVEGERWRQRTEVMRDAIIYNRNNPSIIFYEGGNESISREHMLELKAIRDKYDPYGGRATGSREMLDIDEAEYGGEMLYINKSKKHPMFAMEYCRDEALRKYWDSYSYPYHKEGDGPLHRNKPAEAYNHNQDEFVVELVRRWYDYWRERPGTGTRSSGGGVKIVFSDTNTHYRGAENYRRSGVTDAMRIPKDAFYAHQVMWHGWVDADASQTYIVGHWNYEDGHRTDSLQKPFSKPVYVVSNAPSVELFLNGKSLGKGRQDYHFLYTWDDVVWEKGTLLAVGYDENGKELSRYSIKTAGKPAVLRLTKIENPEGWQADGADLILVEFEVVDAEGNRCPLDNRMVRFSVDGPAEWRGGIAQGPDNYILSKNLPVECGVNRVMLRSTTTSGKVTLHAEAEGLNPQTIELQTVEPQVKELQAKEIQTAKLRNKGLQNVEPASSEETAYTPVYRAAEPMIPTYKQTRVGAEIVSASSDTNAENLKNSFDDNELSEWKGGNSVTYTLKDSVAVDDICIKLSGWRSTNYALEVEADGKILWSGITPTSLGYVHLEIAEPVKSKTYTIRAIDKSKATAKATNFKDAEASRFSNITEVAGGKANELDATTRTKGKIQPLRIVEVEFLYKVEK